jgi:hypothetical protein
VPAPAATRVDPATGVTESIELVGPPGRKLVVSIQRPPDSAAVAGSGVLVCSSIGNEFLRIYRTEVAMGRRIAAAGSTVARFQYLGTGNSDGDELDLDVAGMVADADAVADLLAERHGITDLAVVGTRFGALVAATVSRTRGGRPLALIEPTLDPKRFFRDGLRAKKMHVAKEIGEGHTEAGVGEPATSTSTSDPGTPTASTLPKASTPPKEKERGGEIEQALAERGEVDIMGYRFGRALYASALETRFADCLGDEARPLLVVQLAARPELKGEFDRVFTPLSDRGWPVTTSTVVTDETWWFLRDELFAGESYIDVVADWVSATRATGIAP